MVRSRAVCAGGFNSLGDLDSPAMMALVPRRSSQSPHAGSRRIEPVSVDYAAKAITRRAADLREGDEVTICYRYEGNEKLLLDLRFSEALEGQPCYEEINLGEQSHPRLDPRGYLRLDDLGAARFRDSGRPAAAPTTSAEDRAIVGSRRPRRRRGLLRGVASLLSATYRSDRRRLTKMLGPPRDDNPEAALEAVRLCM